MSDQNSSTNQTTTPGMESLLESIVNLYTTEQNIRQQNNRPRTSTNYPLSFNIQRPRQASTSNPTPAPTPRSPSSQPNTNQQFSGYLSIIHALRDVGNQYNTNVREYNNNMREYNSNIRVILNTVNGIRDDLQMRNNPNERLPRETNQFNESRQYHSRFHDGLYSQNTSPLFSSPHTSRPNQNRSYFNQSTNNNDNNLFDILFQTISLPQNMDNVIVRPTQEQIQNATRSIIYSANNANITTTHCPITLEQFEEQHLITQITYCGHVFSQDGINRWFEGNVRCPICRYDIRNYNARCRHCRRPLQEYGTRCTYCEEAHNRNSHQEEEEEENEDNDSEPERTENNENEEDEDEEPNMDISANPYQVVLNYEIRTPDFTFNSHDISFNAHI